MSYKLNTFLNPSHILDSTCYSVEVFYPHPNKHPIPSAFDSEDLSKIPIIPSLLPSHCHPDLSSNMSSAVKQLVLAPLLIHKPMMPSLTHPLNVIAYIQPDIYANYIGSVFTSSTENIVHFSLIIFVDFKALAHLREENGHQFSDLITYEFDE
jgi:hypothetical protein